MANNRISRENEISRSSRESEKRDNHKRSTYSMGYVSSLDLPPGLARDGFEYFWAAREIGGKVVYQVERLCSIGWQLVPADRCSGYNPDPLKRTQYSSLYYCNGSLILMEREEILGRPEKREFYSYLNDRTNSIQQNGTIVKNDVPHIRANSYNSINSF